MTPAELALDSATLRVLAREWRAVADDQAQNSGSAPDARSPHGDAGSRNCVLRTYEAAVKAAEEEP
jgi:hypothetical protein